MSADILVARNSTNFWNCWGWISDHVKKWQPLIPQIGSWCFGTFNRSFHHQLHNAQLDWNCMTEDAIERIKTLNYSPQTNLRWFWPGDWVHYPTRNTMTIRMHNWHTWGVRGQERCEGSLWHRRMFPIEHKGPSVCQKNSPRPWFQRQPLENVSCGMPDSS